MQIFKTNPQTLKNPSPYNDQLDIWKPLQNFETFKNTICY